jgi:hypothetical protein
MAGVKILPAVQAQRDKVAERLEEHLRLPDALDADERAWLVSDALDTIRSLQAEIRSLRAKRHARDWLLRPRLRRPRRRGRRPPLHHFGPRGPRLRRAHPMTFLTLLAAVYLTAAAVVAALHWALHHGPVRPQREEA